MYLEAVAILPQLVLLQQSRNIDNLTGNYVFLLGYVPHCFPYILIQFALILHGQEATVKSIILIILGCFLELIVFDHVYFLLLEYLLAYYLRYNAGLLLFGLLIVKEIAWSTQGCSHCDFCALNCQYAKNDLGVYALFVLVFPCMILWYRT